QLLLAEDNDLNQMIATAVLSQFDHRVTVVDNGRAAIKAARRETFDLILMDVRMPEMDGPDATRVIRQEPTAIADIPIIAVTADAIVENRQDYLAAGMNACVTKPINVPDLLRAINEVLGEEVHVEISRRAPAG
ncbi:MAG: response regulator, partial [Magnetovibrio sp.]|nr:response regulator [Magnetovibrio sp.]